MVLPLLVVTLAACGRGDDTLALVAGRHMTLEQLKATVSAQTGKPFQDASPDLVAALFEGSLEEEVVLAASDRPGDRDLPPASRTQRARELLASLCPPPSPPREADVDAFLAQHPPAGPSGERLRLRQLVLPDQATASHARERIRRGEDFAAVSRQLSRAPNAADGGLLGWVERGQLPPEFEAAVFDLGPGELSLPVASNAGWHVFQVMERSGPGPDPVARERAREQLLAQAAETARRACLVELARRVDLRVNCAGAPFPCRNPFEETP